MSSKYQWEHNRFPPHCKVVPADVAATELEIFNDAALAKIGLIIANLLFLFDTPKKAQTMEDVEAFNVRHESDILPGPYKADNIGNRQESDWYSDSLFGQQQFVGTNPATIAKVPADLLKEFSEAAASQKVPDDMSKILADGKDLYV